METEIYRLVVRSGVIDESGIWTSEDDTPQATITVSDEPTYIESVTVPKQDTENVESVRAVVKDKDGNDVVSSHATPVLFYVDTK